MGRASGTRGVQNLGKTEKIRLTDRLTEFGRLTEFFSVLPELCTSLERSIEYDRSVAKNELTDNTMVRPWQCLNVRP